VHSARNTAAQFSFGTSVRHRPEEKPKKTQYIGKDYATTTTTTRLASPPPRS